MTIHQAYQQLRFQLSDLYDPREAGNIAELVIENITGLRKIDRLMGKQLPLTSPQTQLLSDFTAALLQHTPVQYVLRECFFYGLRLKVDERVLIPRPETEELADWVIKETKNTARAECTIIDIGTGSGCLALAIKHALPTAHVHASDISTPALELAAENAHNLQVAVEFHENNINQITQHHTLPVADIIVSNPPYIPPADRSGMSKNVLAFEPALALFTPTDDPLLFYRSITRFASTNLAADGTIYFEIHEEMAAGVRTELEAAGFSDVKLRNDLQGKARMVRATRR